MTFVADIADDLETVADGLGAVTLTHRNGAEEVIASALRRAVSKREAASSHGKYTTADTNFHFQSDAVDTSPKVGEIITDSDGDWTILEVGTQTLGTRYRCVCRNLAIFHDLHTLVTIQLATFAKGTGGAQEPTWSTWRENVRAKIVIDRQEFSVEHGRQQAPKQASVFFASPLSLTTNHRIVDPHDGTVYSVKSWQDAEAIDKLFSAQCEVSRWPSN